MNHKKVRKTPWWGLVMAGLLLASCSYRPLERPEARTGIRVTETGDYIEVVAEGAETGGPGFLFVPGGLVRPRAYINSLAPLARRGHRVVIVKVPFDLAITAAKKPHRVAERLGGEWVIGGHSLGGTIASWTVYEHPERYRGLVLLASYTTEEKSLAAWPGPVLSLVAERDGLAGPEEMEGKKAFFPPDATWVVIPGGNHAQFGDYGPQKGDKAATISPGEQHEVVADEVDRFMRRL